MQNFSEKVAVITGGASGIGLALARALAGQGARLVIADIESSKLAAARAELSDTGADVLALRTDVADMASVQALADAAWSDFGAVHLLFNNAGVAAFGPVHQASTTDWQWSLQVNLWGCIHGMQAFVPRMLEVGEEGHILFTASFAGLVANRALGPYNVTKAAVVSLAESLRKDLRDTALDVSVLCPMRVTSDIDNSQRNRPAELGGPAGSGDWSEKQSGLQGRELAAAPVADLVLEAIRRKDAFIHSHSEAGDFLERQHRRITASLDHAL